MYVYLFVVLLLGKERVESFEGIYVRLFIFLIIIIKIFLISDIFKTTCLTNLFVNTIASFQR